MEISKELIIRYLNAHCTSAEEELVGKWLVSSPENTKQAMIWIEELSDEKERVLLQMVLNADLAWNETISKIDGNSDKDLSKEEIEGQAFGFLKISNFFKQYAVVWISVLMLAFAYYLYHKSRIVDVETQYGETKVIGLPDGSKVTLNSKSSIRYAYGWTGQERKVWLTGEAYFSVRYVDNATFKVYLPDNSIVEVLGTEFNISIGKGISQIVLKSGKIFLHLERGAEKPEVVRVATGELIDIRQQKITKSNVNTDLYTSWARGEWRLKNTTLQQILEKVKLRYGVSILVANEKLLAKRASGTVSIMSTNPNVVVEDVASRFNLKMRISDGEILITE